ncbi:hypothetical protein AURDEDRAFT_184885 [Auricularia subglabra TFB-10046 SS5]|nr:hypothetical protein AURDEDRAFT_184885 [Auricularia subglabra TFB-10046 SS5]
MSILQRAISASSASHNPELVGSVIDGVNKTIEATTASAMAWRNAQYSLQDRLPTELWYLIWTRLDLFDRLAVTHVCARWRAAALQCAAMWSHIDFYTSVHHPVCTCRECPNGARMSINNAGWSGTRRYPERSSNWRILPVILARSRDLPLSLRVEVLPSYAADTMIRRLGSALFSHVARLTDVLVLSADSASVSQFLRCFDCLPALRRLSASHIQVPTSGTETFIHAPIDLPVLEHLDIATDELTWPTSVRLAFPAVRTLSFRVADRRDILSALRVCTGLSKLQIRLKMFGRTQSSLDVTELHERAAKVESISIGNIAPADEHWLIAAFQHPPRRELELQYYGLPIDGLKLFADLSPMLKVTLSYSEFGNRITAADDEGRTRALDCTLNGINSEQRIYEAVWPYLLPGHEITSLTLNSDCWAAFAETFPRDELSLTHLGLVVSGQASLADVSASSRGRLTFSCLTSLRISRGWSGIPLAARDVAAFVRFLDAPVRLDALTVVRAPVTEEDDLLDEFATSVFIVELE